MTSSRRGGKVRCYRYDPSYEDRHRRCRGRANPALHQPVAGPGRDRPGDRDPGYRVRDARLEPEGQAAADQEPQADRPLSRTCPAGARHDFMIADIFLSSLRKMSVITKITRGTAATARAGRRRSGAA